MFMLSRQLILHKLGQFRFFWVIRHTLRRCLFNIFRVIFGIRENSFKEYVKFKAFRVLVQMSNNQFLLALFSAIIIQYLDPFIVPWVLKFGLKSPEPTTYITLLGAVAGIGGVFIGLYYAAISTIGSAIYARTPNNIRDLLANERLGYTYMSVLSYMTFTCLIFIAIYILGFPPTFLATVFTVFLSGIGIISFVKLGQRAFYFFDPTQLAISLFGEMSSYLKHAQPNAFRWLDPAFQNHAKKLASRTADAIATLSDIAKNETHLNGQPYTNIAEQVCYFLAKYQDEKKTIPTNSMWYGQKYIQRNWYSTDESILHTATITCTQIAPETVPDKNWLDNRLVEIIKQCLFTNYNSTRFGLVMQLLDSLDYFLQKSTNNLFIVQACNILNDVTTSFLEALETEKDFLINTELLERIAISERISNICINVLLLFVKYSETQPVVKIEQKVASINWNSKKDIYKHGFLTHLLKQIETFQQQLAFEKDCESTIISPNWYLTELIVLAEARVFAECVNEITGKWVNRFANWAELCRKKQRFWILAALQSRELEYWNKVEYHLKVIENAWCGLISKKHTDGLLWPELHFDTVKQTIAERQKRLLGEISSQSNLLSLLHRPDDFPDYAGQFLHLTAHSILRAICEPDEILLASTYKPFFYASITKFQELRPKVKADDWRYESQVNVAAAPIIDLLEISGYTKLMSSFYNKPSLWDLINKIWNEYLSAPDTPKDVLNFYAACVNVTDAGLGIAYRGVTRHSWKQAIYKILGELPRKKSHRRGLGIHASEEVIHKDPLVRIFARERMGSIYDGIDIFILEFIRKNDEYKTIKFNRKRERLSDNVEREKKRSSGESPTVEENI